MKKLRLLVASLSSCVILLPTLNPAPIAAQEDNCVLITANGQTMDLSSLCGANPAPGTTSSNSPRWALIKRREGGVPVIDVEFTGSNGSVIFEMAVDTGASGTAITRNMATVLGVKPIGVAYVDTASHNAVPVTVARVDRIRVNGVALQDVPVGILPSLDIGLLGQDFFKSYDLLIRQDVIEFLPANR
jgi:predicted aspartyl protease